MGLGKTLQSLAVLQARTDDGPALVVAPTSVCANWIAEAARFTPELDVVEYRGAGRTDRLEWIGPGHVLVTSYDILVRDADDLGAIAFATAIFDEAQAIKNGLSKRAAASREVQASFRIALTGTPVENHTGDLWSIFRTIVPGLFGSWEDFRARFSLPIDRDRDPARRDALAAMVRPYLLRRTKREVSPELPPRTEIVRLVDPTPEEQALYEAERAHAVASLARAPGDRGPGDEGRFAVLAALTRLRQLACHPRLRNPDAPGTSAKLEAVLAMIDELREAGHKALVFSQFTSHLAIVAQALRERGVTFFELDGSTAAEARADRVRRFQAGEADMFLISLKAGGVGLNLTAADYVLHLDPWWNPASEDQASDRAHRIGQDKPVTIVRFVTRGTIEETVLSLHDDKRELAEAILSGGDVAGRLSTRELFALIETGPSAAPAPPSRRARSAGTSTRSERTE
jgi:SNF2 family DNA or RNA helicase